MMIRQNSNAIERIPDRVWLPVYTQPNHEARLVRYLQAHGIPYYLPQIRKVYVKQVRRRSKVDRYERTKQKPMFPNYVFAALSAEEEIAIWRSDCVIRLLRVNEYEEQELIGELNAVRRFEEIAADRAVECLPELVKGRKVRITSGYWKDTVGHIVEHKDKFIFAVNIEIMHRSVITEFDAAEFNLVPVD